MRSRKFERSRAATDRSRAAIRRGGTIALANKESLVAGGDLVLRAAKPGQLIPVDSEHSALAQVLRAGTKNEISKLILTASGGPFRNRNDLSDVTLEEALAHPTWNMGPVVTINSATLVNKGLEIIEAFHLFGCDYDDIEVLIHKQSIIHSMVEYKDYSVIAQLGTPDMMLPIQYAMTYPSREEIKNTESLNLAEIARLDFKNVANKCG